jgi:cyanate permease
VATQPVGGGLPLSNVRLAVLAGGSSLATWAAIALSTYLVAAAIHDGFSESAAGYLLFAGSLSSIAGRIAAGAVADRRHSRGFAAVATLLVAGSFVFAGLIAASGAVFAVLVLVAFATGWGWPGLMTYTVVNANLGSAAASSAVTQAGVFLGAGLGPLVLGWLVDRHGFDVAWMAVVIALAVAAVVVAGVGRVSAPRPTG